MVERRELITICRQIGGMMDAGVDILRITRVLRAQTTNPRLLELYDQLDHDLRMGHSIADAMEHAPDIFSPFAVSIVRQGESRNELAAAFLKVADYEQKDEVGLSDERLADPNWAVGTAGSGRAGRVPTATVSPLTVIVLNDLVDRLQLVALRALTIAAGLLLSLAGVWLMVEIGLVEERWRVFTLFSVAALFIGGSGVWIRRSIERDRVQKQRCSFCGGTNDDGSPLAMAAHLAGASICAGCIANLNGGKLGREGSPTVQASAPASGGYPANGALHHPNGSPVVSSQAAGEAEYD